MKKSIVYTRTGDSGTTSLVGGQRVPKNQIRIEAYGTIDELNSHIGIIAAYPTHDHRLSRMLQFIQHRLFNIGAYLASDPQGATYTAPPGVDHDDVARLENMIDTLDAELPPINRFILPGGSVEAAQCHVARTVCRRAERRITDLADTTPIDSNVMRFINRLSDFLFILARFNNVNRRIPEIFWDKDC